MTKILTPQEVHEVAERGINLLEGDIAILNSMIIESYRKFLIIPHLDFMVFHQDDFKTDLKIVCNHLIESGWSAEYKSCQRDGNWIHVSFSKKNIEFSEDVIEDLKERDKKRHQDIIDGVVPKCVRPPGISVQLPGSDESLKRRMEENHKKVDFITRTATELKVATPENRCEDLDEIRERLKEYSPKIREQSQRLEKELEISRKQRQTRYKGT